MDKIKAEADAQIAKTQQEIKAQSDAQLAQTATDLLAKKGKDGSTT